MYMPSKIRTQLYLDARQKKVLEEKSVKMGKSVGYLIREAIDEYLRLSEPEEGPIAPDDPLWGIVGLGESTTGDGSGSERHDEHIYDREHESWKKDGAE